MNTTIFSHLLWHGKKKCIFFCVLVGFRLCFSGCILPAYHRLNSCSITAAAAVAAVAEVQQQQAGGGAE